MQIGRVASPSSAVSSPRSPSVAESASLGSLWDSLGGLWGGLQLSASEGSESPNNAAQADVLTPEWLDALVSLRLEGHDVIPMVEKCLQVKNPSLQREGAQEIRQLAREPSAQGKAAVGSVTSRALLLILAEAKEDEEGREAAREALLALNSLCSGCTPNKRHLPVASTNGLKGLVKYLRAESEAGEARERDEEMATLAAQLAFTLSEEGSNKERLKASGVITALVPLLEWNPSSASPLDSQAAWWAAKTLNNAASLRSCIVAAVEAGAVPLLTDMLQPCTLSSTCTEKELRVAKRATSVLVQLATGEFEKSQMRAAKHLPRALVILLGAGTEKERLNVLELIQKLAENNATWTANLILEDPLPAISKLEESLDARLSRKWLRLWFHSVSVALVPQGSRASNWRILPTPPPRTKLAPTTYQVSHYPSDSSVLSSPAACPPKMVGGAWDGATCQVCGDGVGFLQQRAEVNGGVPPPKERFVACQVCRFPVCQACYEYERREGSRSCPHCKTVYPRLPGQGDDEADGYLYTQPASYMRPPDAVSVTASELYGDQHQQQQQHMNMSMIGGAHPGYPGYPSQPGHSPQHGYDDQYSIAGESEDNGRVPEPETPGTARTTGTNMGTLAVAPANQPPMVAPLGPTVSGSNLPAPFAGGKQWEVPGKEKDSSFEEEEARQPLCRKVPLPSNLINPYRLVIVIRLLVTGGFFYWRFTNVPEDAVLLWAASLFCEIWFFCSWMLDQFPKWSPIKRETFKDRLSIRFEPKREGDDNRLSSVDLFVSTVDPIKEPAITTANTLLSILALDYPPEKIAAYLSDDGGSMITFDCMAETAEFARHWVPFCRRYKIEPRCPDVYFLQKLDILKDKVDIQFVTDRRDIKKMYEEFKVRINGLVERKMPADGWVMQDGTPWPGNKTRDHPGMIQVFLGPSGGPGNDGLPLPRMVYVSREKRPGYAHHKKAGAMNSLIRVSAVLTNAPYILNLDCDHYINNAQALKDAMCVMMDESVGKKTCYVQFPQRFDGIDPNDRYANHNTVFFDINMPGLDGVQGPVYVGTGCCFRRAALYGHVPPKKDKHSTKGLCCSCIGSCCTGVGSCIGSCCSCCSRGPSRRRLFGKRSRSNGPNAALTASQSGEDVFAGGGGITPHPFAMPDGDDEAAMQALAEYESKYGRSPVFVLSTFQEEGVSSSLGPVQASGGSTLKEAIHVLSCGYEDQTAWGKEIGWIYGSITEDILTGFKMHCRGWRSVYCMPRRVAFKGSAPINLSDRLQQVLRWALGSVEIFSSRHCPIWYGWKANKLKFLQRLSYVNTAVYPFTSLPLVLYCMLPPICLFTNKFIMPQIDTWSTLYFIGLFTSILATGILEMRWSGVSMTEWWRNEQFWVIGGVSAHLFAVFQGMLKVLAGIDTNFTVTAKTAGDDAGEFAELYLFKWTSLLIPPTFLVIINVLGIASAFWHAINTGLENWGPMFGKIFFSMWVILHLYPFMKGLGGRSKRIPTLVVVWAVLLASIFSLLWVKVDPWSDTITGPQNCGVRC